MSRQTARLILDQMNMRPSMIAETVCSWRRYVGCNIRWFAGGTSGNWPGATMTWRSRGIPAAASCWRRPTAMTIRWWTNRSCSWTARRSSPFTGCW